VGILYICINFPPHTLWYTYLTPPSEEDGGEVGPASRARRLKLAKLLGISHVQVCIHIYIY
jgi:hypothetical protein